MNYEIELRDLLSQLPHKRQVRFAYDCALDRKNLMKDPRSLKALEVTALWLEDKATKEEIKATTEAAYDAIYATSAASLASAPAASAHVISLISLVSYTFSPVDVAVYASKALKLPLEHYYTKLVNSLTEIEKEIYDVTA